MLTIESNLLTIRLDFLFVCTCLRREQLTEYLNTIDLSPLYLFYTSPLSPSSAHRPIHLFNLIFKMDDIKLFEGLNIDEEATSRRSSDASDVRTVIVCYHLGIYRS